MPRTYTVPPKFRKLMRKKSADKVGAIMAAVQQLSENPRHPSLQAARLGGTENWYCRTSKGDRIEYAVEGNHIILLVNCNHDMLRKH